MKFSIFTYKAFFAILVLFFFSVKANQIFFRKTVETKVKVAEVNKVQQQPVKVVRPATTTKEKKPANNNKAARQQQTNFAAVAATQSVDKAIAVPGDVLNYTLIINNTTGVNATGISFTTTIDPNTTLVAGSVKATPVAVDDAYSCIGNVGINVNTVAGGVLNNDISPDGTSLTVAILANPSSGTASLSTNGTFTYNANVGFSGTDNFTYTVTSSNGKTATGSVTITVSAPIYFVNKAAAASGTGTLQSPFKDISNVTGTGSNTIFVYFNASNYVGTLTLAANQKLIGQGATASLISITGITVPPFSNSLPSTGGTNPTIANASTTLTLNSGNDIEGINIANTGGTAMTGSSVGALKVRDVTLSNTVGQALQITAGGALDCIFKSISATGAAKGISVNSSTGVFEVLGTGTTAGSGGTINNITTRGAEFITVASVTLKNMNFINANTSSTACSSPASDNSSCNAAIHLKTISTAAVFDNISVTGTNNNFGINLNDVAGFKVSNSTITAVGGATGVVGNEAGGIYALNLSGTCSITNSNINDCNGRNFYCENNGSKVMNLTVTGSQFKNTFGKSVGGSNFTFRGFGASNNTLTLKSNNFSNPRNYGLDISASGASINTVQVGGSTLAEGNTITAAASSPGSNAFALQTGVAHTGSMNYNILNNNFQCSFNGVDIFNIGHQGSGVMQGRCNNNTATALNPGNANGIGIYNYGTGQHRAEVLNNTITGTKNYGIIVESNDNGISNSTGRVDATVKNNNVSMIADAYAHVGVISVSNSNAGTSIKSCGNIGNNTTNDPVANLAAGQFDVLAQNTGSSTTQVLLQGVTAFTPSVGNQSTALTNFWNANNVGIRTAVDEGGGGSIISGVCIAPSNPIALRMPTTNMASSRNNTEEANENQMEQLEIARKNNSQETESKMNTVTKLVEGDISIDLQTTTVQNFAIGNFRQSAVGFPLSGETITVNGAGSGFNLPDGKSTTITYQVTVNASNTIPANTCTITNQGTVTGNAVGAFSVQTDDPAIGGTADATVTSIKPPVPTGFTFNTQNITCMPNTTVNLAATVTGGTLKWYTALTGGTSIGSGNITVTPNGPGDYYAENDATYCASNRVKVLTITGTVTPALPTSIAVSSPTVCIGNSVTLSATSANTINWYFTDINNPVGTGASLAQSPTSDKVYYATSKSGTCESALAPVGGLAVTVTMPTIATTNQTQTTAAANQWFYNNAGCNSLITKLIPNGASPISGSTTAKVWIEATQPVEYVKRHYEITPAANATTATGRVTLYFTDADFISFNTQLPGPVLLLPLSTDAPAVQTARKANLRIEKRPGTSGDGSGLPTSYSGAAVTIDPNDADIFWNATDNRWEVSFDVTGFSGFFVKTISTTLPVNWISVSATLNSNKQAVISWKVRETNVAKYEIQKSENGVDYYTIGWLNSKGDGENTYTFNEATALQGKGYYRIKQNDNNEKISYSSLMLLNVTKNSALIIYPNPAENFVTISNAKVGSILLLTDLSGKVLERITVTQSTFILSLSKYAGGVYMLKDINNDIQKIIKQ